MNLERRLDWDWYSGTIPENVFIDETAYLETSFSFLRYRSTDPAGVRLAAGAATYLGTMFDVGPRGHVSLGTCAFSHGVWFISDAGIDVGDYTMLSWNVVLMDSYRVPLDAAKRRRLLERTAQQPTRILDGGETARPIRIGNNVWIGFDVCVLPGVTIGDGSIVGARSVVTSDVPPYSVAAGNPAQVIRSLEI
jgi:acetyltransferase-like isoleucine patch superfamily enzyme